MPRKGNRTTVAKNIYLDSGGYEIRVMVGGHVYSARMTRDRTLDELKAKRAELEARGRTESPRNERGTLAADVARYLKLIQHLESWKDRRAHLNAWIDRIGTRPRHRITPADILSARVAWLSLKSPLAPKTINHRVDTLRHLYRTLDGPKAKTPCDDIEPLHVPKTPIVRITSDLILAVDAKLQQLEADCRLARRARYLRHCRARFRVYASTGKRPCEIGWTQRGDINFEQRVWVPRDAKGGFCPGVYLNEDQLAAWRFFDEADAYGPFHTGKFAIVLRLAGWPAGVRPYHMRHSTWITASERGIDLEDISVGAGHKDPRMTRRVYVPVLNSRLQRLSEAIDGRFQGFPMVPISVTGRKLQRKKR